MVKSLIGKPCGPVSRRAGCVISMITTRPVADHGQTGYCPLITPMASTISYEYFWEFILKRSVNSQHRGRTNNLYARPLHRHFQCSRLNFLPWRLGRPLFQFLREPILHKNLAPNYASPRSAIDRSSLIYTRPPRFPHCVSGRMTRKADFWRPLRPVQQNRQETSRHFNPQPFHRMRTRCGPLPFDGIHFTPITRLHLSSTPDEPVRGEVYSLWPPRLGRRVSGRSFDDFATFSRSSGSI